MSGQPDIRLLLADVDGTLVPKDKVLTEATKQVVRELRRVGIVFAITSGRPPRGMSMLIESLVLQRAIPGFRRRHVRQSRPFRHRKPHARCRDG